MIKRLVTATAQLWICSEGFLRIELVEGAVITEKDVREHFRLIAAELPSTPRPILVDTRRVKSVTREARELLNGEVLKQAVVAQALLVSSPVSRLIASFFLGLNRPQFPCRFFSDEDEALAWLRGFRS